MGAAGRFLYRSTLLASGAVGTGAVAMVQTRPESGFSRSLRFWAGVMPMYTHYKFVEWRAGSWNDGTNPYEALNERYAPKMETLALNLKGFYYKMVQVMSTRDEFLPEQYMKWAKKLQDRSPRVMDKNEVRATVEKALGMKLEDAFETWDDEVLGAASIGQVHKATMKRTGETVAVKVQYPGIEEKFRNDIATVELFCEYLMPQNKPYFSEVKKQFATEFDYVGEAANLREVHESLSKSKWKNKVAVPRPIEELCARNVLTMTFLEGDRMIDGVRSQFRRLAEGQGKNFEEFEKEQKELLESGVLERREVGDSARRTARIGWLLRLYDAAVNSAIWVGNWTLAPVIREKPWGYVRSEAPINLGAILETLLRVHGHEIFIDGAFNADPHPGNVLLMPDGRLGLIDYGQFKRLSLKDRIIYAKLILALHREDRPEVIRIITQEVGFRTKHMNEDVIYRSIVFYNDRDDPELMMNMNVHHFMEWLEAQDPPVQVNDEFVLLARVSILLRGMAHGFGLKLRVSDYWSVEAEQFLKSQGIDY